MKKLLVSLLLVATPAFAAVDMSGSISTVKIWGNIAKAKVCNSNNTCKEYWVSLSDAKGNSVLSMWLTAKVTKSPVYIQGYPADKPEHPYNNASRFYGMDIK